ncbi:tripartite tricarboxylate transporter substrate binding protein [Rhodobacteraceae bacterium CCMM004]|nr:tripartite tricarboxylate transporter substrate binding protein [Rhodobacteraceae bacterium CCMM004]
MAGAAALGVAFAGSAAVAEEFPTKEVTLLVNYGAGGGVDRTARAVQPFLPDALGQNVIVENIGGAGGKTGLKAFMQMPRDGYTVLTAFAPATTYTKFTDPDVFEMSDLAVIAVMWTDPAILLARKDTGWTSLEDFIAYAKANPGDVTFGSSGKGSVGPILARTLFSDLGLDVRLVPYSGGGETRKAFASGEVMLTAAGAGGATSIADEAVALGLFAPEGSAPDWPDAPSINDQLAAMDAEVPEGGAYRFFAVHSDVKRDYPERFDALVEAFRQTIVDNEDFKAAAAESGVGTDWQGADAAQALIEDVDARFTDILNAEGS